MLKVALVGVGGISGAHIPAWREMEDVELVAFRADNEMLLSAVLHNHHYRARKVEDFTINVKCDFTPKTVYKLPEGKEIPSRISGNEISFACEDFGMFTMFKIK